MSEEKPSLIANAFNAVSLKVAPIAAILALSFTAASCTVARQKINPYLPAPYKDTIPQERRSPGGHTHNAFTGEGITADGRVHRHYDIYRGHGKSFYDLLNPNGGPTHRHP